MNDVDALFAKNRREPRVKVKDPKARAGQVSEIRIGWRPGQIIFGFGDIDHNNIVMDGLGEDMKRFTDFVDAFINEMEKKKT